MERPWLSPMHRRDSPTTLWRASSLIGTTGASTSPMR
nr:MAG TPA: hypothetical protein [Caudoviricetes sp.]